MINSILFCFGQLIFPDGSIQSTAMNPVPTVTIISDSTAMQPEADGIQGYAYFTGYTFNENQNGQTASFGLTFVDFPDTDAVFIGAGIWDAILGTPLDVYVLDVRALILAHQSEGRIVYWCTTLDTTAYNTRPYNFAANKIAFELGVKVYDINKHDIVLSSDGVHATAETSQRIGEDIVRWINNGG